MTDRVGLKRQPKWNKYFDSENSKYLARDNHPPTMSCYYFGSGKCLFMRLLKSPDCLHEYWVVTFPDTFRRKHVVCQCIYQFVCKKNRTAYTDFPFQQNGWACVSSNFSGCAWKVTALEGSGWCEWRVSMSATKRPFSIMSSRVFFIYFFVWVATFCASVKDLSLILRKIDFGHLEEETAVNNANS